MIWLSYSCWASTFQGSLARWARQQKKRAGSFPGQVKCKSCLPNEQARIPSIRIGQSHVTFGGHINYMSDKTHVIIIFINTQGQIVRIYFTWKNCLTWNHVAGSKFHLKTVLCHLAGEKERFSVRILSCGRV